MGNAWDGYLSKIADAISGDHFRLFNHFRHFTQNAFKM